MDRFSQISYILQLALAALAGAFIDEIFKRPVGKWFSNKRDKRKNKRLAKILGSKNFEPDKGYFPIERAIPYFEKQNIQIAELNKAFIIGVPDQFLNDMAEHEFISNNKADLDGEDILKHLGSIGVSRPYNRLAKARIRAAESLLADLRKGRPRFNNNLYGIYNVYSRRIGAQECPGLKFEFYKTDYFTFRVLAELYAEIENKEELFKIRSIADLSRFRPFLASFGIACYVVLNRGRGDEIIIGHRSGNVAVDRKKMHFSMNEALSEIDRNRYHSLDFDECVIRGLHEELGVGPANKDRITDLVYLDFGLDINRFEAGISCVVRYEIDESHGLEEFYNSYEIAKDKHLETGKLDLIHVTDIGEYLDEKADRFSAGARSCLKSIETRYKHGYLPLK